MVVEYLVLGAGVKVASDAIRVEYLKSKQLELSDTEKQEFTHDKDRRFIHFTSESNAKKIMKSGFLIPTKGVLKNHYTKSIDSRGKKKNSDMVYMFDSKTFSVDDYIRNLPKKRSPYNGCYEYYAISTRPDEHEINNFKKRAHDGAITYEGRLDIDGTDTKLTKYVLGLDEQGKYKFQEVAMDYEYTPPQELLDKLSHEKMGMLKYNLTTYMSEVRKSKESKKRFKAQKEEYKEQIRKKKDFAKANRQFIQEEKDKDYVFEKDGRTIVVKNIEYEEIGGKKLQKLAIIENSGETKNKKLGRAMKFCYMDEFNIADIENDVATQYFFNNLDRIKESQSTVPEYIGLPLQNLETGDVTNEYDTTFDKTFKQYMERRQKSQDKLDRKYDEIKSSQKWTHKIKAMFSRVLGRKDVKLLEESRPKDVYELEDRDALSELGYSSVEALNRDDKEAEMFKFLQGNKYPPEEVTSYDQSYEEPQNIEEQDLTIEGQ